MKSKIGIKEITTRQGMLAQFPLIRQLNPGLKKGEYEKMLDEMLLHGYRMAGAFAGKKCVALSGFWISTKIYSGKYVELDNVVVDRNYRSAGLGKLLCDWVMAEAKKQGCITAMLDAYLENLPGHKFYLREGFIIRGFHFIKKL